MTDTGWSWVIAAVAALVLFCMNSGYGTTQKPVIRTRLSGKNPLVFIIIGLVVYFITANHLW